MKRLSLIFTLLILMFTSCDKDENAIEQELVTKNEIIESRSNDSKDIDSLFFDIKYVYNTLKLNSNYDGYVSGVDELIEHYEEIEKSRLQDLEKNGNYPCWYCTEADHFDALNYYTPFYNLTSGDFKGVLISRKENEVIYSVIMTDELSKAMSNFEQESISVYVDKVFDYFRGGSKGKNFKNYSDSRSEACLESEADGLCYCQYSSGECIDISGNHVGGIKCLKACGGAPGDGPDNLDGHNNPDGYDVGGVGTCYFCGSFSVNINTQSGGGGGTQSNSQFDYPERLDILAQLLNYIDAYTSIYLNLGNQLALSNETHFDYTTYLLYTNMENMTEDQIEAYIQLITNHRHFISDDAMSTILLYNAGLSSSLNSFLTSNNSSDLSYQYGHVITVLSQDNSWPDLITNSQELMEITQLTFSNTEIEHILTFEPELITEIKSFVDNHVNDPLANQIVHDFLALQQCDTVAPCIHTDYNNDFEKILSFYNSLTPNNINWLSKLKVFMEEFNIELPYFDLMTFITEDCSSCNVTTFENKVGEVILENHFGVPITNVLLIDGYIFGKDANGILKIYLPSSPDPSELSSQELFDQVILVLNCVNLYYCETEVYEPIDWKDYFINVSGSSYVINWNANVTFETCPVTMLLDFTWGGNVMNTSYSHSSQTSDDPPINNWKWNGVNTDAALLQIATKSSNGCKDILYYFFNPNCN